LEIRPHPVPNIAKDFFPPEPGGAFDNSGKAVDEWAGKMPTGEVTLQTRRYRAFRVGIYVFFPVLSTVFSTGCPQLFHHTIPLHGRLLDVSPK
jgi:hypothetical protein